MKSIFIIFIISICCIQINAQKNLSDSELNLIKFYSEKSRYLEDLVHEPGKEIEFGDNIDTQLRELAFIRALDRLDNEEKAFLVYNYGLFGVEQLTIKELGEMHGYSFTKTRLKIVAAKNKLKEDEELRLHIA